MDSLHIKEIFSTIGIGLYVIIALVLLFFALRDLWELLFASPANNRNLFPSFKTPIYSLLVKGEGASKERENNLPEFFIIPMMIVCYCIGLVAEQVTEYYDDGHDRKTYINSINGFVPFVHSDNEKDPYFSLFTLNLMVPQKNALKLYAVMGQDDSGICRINSLGRQYLQVANMIYPAYYSPYKREEVREIGKALLGMHKGISPGDSIISWQDTLKGRNDTVHSAWKKPMSDYISALYYMGKNWCYTKETYFEELDGLHKTVDYTRSLAYINEGFIILVVGLFGLSVALRFLLFLWWLLLCVIWKSKKHLYTGNNFKSHFWILIRRLLYLYFAFIVAAWLFSRAYTYSEKNYIERVFGYYGSNFDVAETSHILHFEGAEHE